MIVAHGVLAAGFAPAGSVADAVRAAAAGDGMAWIAAQDASPDELQELGRALGLRARELARVVHRRDAPRTPRARVTRLGAGAHVIVLGWEPEPHGGARKRGQLELLATPTALAVLASDLPEPMRAPALLDAVCDLRDQVEATGAAAEPLGLVLSHVLDYYEEVLDVLEGEASALAGAFSAPLRSEMADVAGRLARLDALLDSAQQTDFNLAQDEANRLTSAQSDITRKMSGYTLLIAIPTIAFSLYGTNFNHVPLIGENRGYGVMLGLTLVLCLVAWRKLRTAGWL